MSKEEAFKDFVEVLKLAYGYLTEDQLVIIKTGFDSGYFSGYATAINEVNTFIMNQADTLRIETGLK